MVENNMRHLYRNNTDINNNINNINTNRNTNRNTHGNTERNTDRNTDINTDRNTDINTHRNTNINTHRNTDINTHRNTDINTHRNTERNTHRDTNITSNLLNRIMQNLGNSTFWDNISVFPSDQQINDSLTVIDFNSLEESSEPIRCPITMEIFNETSNISRMNQCNHTFNTDAIRRWFRGHTTCPVCRIDIRDSTTTTNSNTTNSNTNTIDSVIFETILPINPEDISNELSNMLSEALNINRR